MVDDLNKRRPQDQTKVNLSQPWEVEYWTREFGISEVRLRTIITNVGNGVGAIREYIKKHGR